MAETPVFELRTYHAAPGRLADLEARFRDHTMRIFGNHGIEVVGFWRPTDEPASADTLIYLIRWPSRATATRTWADFFADPEWQAVKTQSEVEGALAPQIDIVYLEATDLSPLR